MNVIELPLDILYLIFDEMNSDIIPLLTTNKELHQLSQERLNKKREKYNNKILFFAKCKNSDHNFWWNAFHSVITQEECEFVREKYKSTFDEDNFNSRVRYTIGNTYQVTEEAWYEYAQQHSITR